uniref:Uncharacterized protein n=1 Tax=Tanacetum cinerariifolium TaxID=118510 RepID=A0A699HRT1_TANCI|nr:hypothetical protein [Tanacetum cinerariifolium]
MQVTLHYKRIVMQVALHYEEIVMQITLHDKRIVMQVTLHFEAIVMQVTLHDKRIVMQVTLHYEAIMMQVTLHDKRIVIIQAKKKKELEQEYILIRICTTNPLNSQGPKDNAVDAAKKATEVDENRVSDNGGQDDQVTRSEFDGLIQQERKIEHINNTNSFNTVVSLVNTAGPSFANTASPS